MLSGTLFPVLLLLLLLVALVWSRRLHKPSIAGVEIVFMFQVFMFRFDRFDRSDGTPVMLGYRLVWQASRVKGVQLLIYTSNVLNKGSIGVRFVSSIMVGSSVWACCVPW